MSGGAWAAGGRRSSHSSSLFWTMLTTAVDEIVAPVIASTWFGLVGVSLTSWTFGSTARSLNWSTNFWSL